MIYLVIHIYSKADRIINRERKSLEIPITQFVDNLASTHPAIKHLPGVGVYIGHHQDSTPLALRACLNDFHEIHQETIIVTIEVLDLAHIDKKQQIIEKEFFHNHGTIVYLHVQFGYHDQINVPKVVKEYLNKRYLNELAYFISLSDIVYTTKHTMPLWQKQIFKFMFDNSISMTDFFHLPLNETIQIKYPIEL